MRIGGSFDKDWVRNPDENMITSDRLKRWVTQYPHLEGTAWIEFFRRILAIPIPKEFIFVIPWLFNSQDEKFYIKGGLFEPHIIYVPNGNEWENIRILYEIPPIDSNWDHNMDSITEVSLKKGIGCSLLEMLQISRSRIKDEQTNIQEVSKIMKSFVSSTFFTSP